MTSTQIRTLLAPPDIHTAQQKTISALDQSLNDLSELETLVLDAQRRSDDLQAKLSLSLSEITTLLADTRASAESHIHTAQELSLLRHSLTDDLTELSQELISVLSEDDSQATLLEDIETLHRNLKELETMKGYVQVIEHALKLSECSTMQIVNPKITISNVTLSGYETLHTFVENVSEACSKLEGDSTDQQLNLVLFLKNIRQKTWTNIQDTLSKSLTAIAEKIGWPTSVNYPAASVEDRAEFEHTFRNLLNLQNWGERNHLATKGSEKEKGLYPMRALIHPLALRFKYHFDGTRETNRLDKPEWYFTHILNVAHEQRTFMETVIQRLLDSSDYRHIKAWHEFTYLLLPLLSRKLKHAVPSLLPHPSLFAHTIYQALVFDTALMEDGFLIQGTSAYQEASGEDKWEGVSQVILGNAEWFGAWLQGEHDFAKQQYHDIIHASDAWHIIAADQEHEEDVQAGLKVTHSARRICSLIEQVTDRYSPLPRSTQRTAFLISVQLPLLDSYLGRITDSLDAFETLSSAFVRAVPGALGVNLGKDEGSVRIDNKGLTSGVEAVQRLCKALLSATCVESAMRGWAEELSFIELWTEINHKPELRTLAQTCSLLSGLQNEHEEIPDNTLFDELISRYQHISTRSEGMIVQQACAEIEGLLKTHFSNTLSKPGSQSDQVEVALSQTLLAPIALLSSYLAYLRSSMSSVTLTTLYRKIAARLATHILQRQILYRSQFDLLEGKSIRVECELWVETCRIALSGALPGGRTRIDGPWTKLLQAASLVSGEGDAWTAVLKIAFGTQTDDVWSIQMAEAVGPIELERDTVVRTLRRREDCGY